jgi:hypothetical protein
MYSGYATTTSLPCFHGFGPDGEYGCCEEMFEWWTFDMMDGSYCFSELNL